MRIAIVGTGISGLTSAYILSRQHDVTVFESNDRIGGHTNTVTFEKNGRTHRVDTGFIVHNRTNYPHFIRLLNELGVETQPSDMSFSVTDSARNIEYRATNLNTVFAQRRNLLRPKFYRMLFDIVRFNKYAQKLAIHSDKDESEDSVTLGEFANQHKLSAEFVDWFLRPLGSAVWSADPETFLDFPAATYARFMNNHQLLKLRIGKTWRTIVGGSNAYLAPLTASIADRIKTNCAVHSIKRNTNSAGGAVLELTTSQGVFKFDGVVISCHSDQALGMLSDASPEEKEILGAIGYQPNRVSLHTDESVMPRNRRSWASWNHRNLGNNCAGVQVTYWMNMLQSLNEKDNFFVTLNSDVSIDPAKVIASFDYQHPVYNEEAVAAQRRLPEIQGVNATYFAGAYWGYGFHEDGVVSGVEAAKALGVTW